MDITFIHGDRYVLMVVLHLSHGQKSTNKIYLPMDILNIYGHIILLLLLFYLLSPLVPRLLLTL